MISSNNIPLNSRSSDADFTVESYREMLRLAKQSYAFALYDSIPWGRKFVLWRHDCDYSLNRAHALARVEVEEGVRATYFLNPHCEYYNLYERGQYRLVQEILEMGHRIGLHFDAAFYAIPDEESLAICVRKEAAVLEMLFGAQPAVFSFHNPVASHMGCEEDVYGGLINCYSRRFKSEVPYCSDSNGYWRFRRLRDVLTKAADPCLQVLTHPDWWQEAAMPPRQRIFRSVYGRAKATMQLYDAGLDAHGRQNIAGAMGALRFFKSIDPNVFDLCDLLWNRGEFPTLFIELWRLHERQLTAYCKAVLCKQWGVPANEVNRFFESVPLGIDGKRLFEEVFKQPWRAIAGVGEAECSRWISLRNELIRGRSFALTWQLEDGCVFLCQVIEKFMVWGKAQPINCDGVSHLDAVGASARESVDGNPACGLEDVVEEFPSFRKMQWELFKAEIEKISAGGSAT